MALNLEFLNESNRSSLYAFAAKNWPNRPATPTFFSWRYEHNRQQKILMVLRNGECLATVGAFVKQYRIGEKTLECLDTCDWYTLPQYHGSGLGIKVIKALMELGTPLWQLGGSADTLNLLPKLGWQTIGTGSRYVLPVSGNFFRKREAVSAAWKPILGFLFDLAGSKWFRSSLTSNTRSELEMLPVPQIEESVLNLYDHAPYAVLQLPDPHFYNWLIAGRITSNGVYLPFYFKTQDHLWGWGIGRVAPYHGCLVGYIIDFYAPSQDQELVFWALKAMISTLCGFGVTHIETVTTCHSIQAILKRHKFIARPESPLMIWTPNQSIPPGPIHIMAGISDEAFRQG